MLDIKFIRENVELVREAAKKKRIELDVDALIKADRDRVALMTQAEALRARQNEVSDHIAKESDSNLREKLISQMRDVKTELQAKEEEMKAVMKTWQTLMLQVPNIPDMSVPDGDSDQDNQEFKTWGTKPTFSFEPKSHIELAENLNGVNFTAGAKVSGFRGYFLEGELARVSLALWQLAFDELTAAGFTPLITPSLVRPENLMGTGYLPQGADDLYTTQDGDYLSGTAEVATMGYFAGEVLDLKDLPKKIVALSPCFRREAGSHGKDTKGLIRVHEFFKVEQVVLCEANHETSVEWHEKLLAAAESLMQKLEIPYHVVVNASGDLGLGQVKKYDIEAWVPSENNYRETHSISYFHDFQTRRLNIRYKDADGKMRFAHSLNGTALATPRLLVALLENNQQVDGSIKWPAALGRYLAPQA